MSKTAKLMFLALISLGGLVACGKKEEPKKVEAPTAIAVPADASDDQAWKVYLSSVVKKNMEGIRQSPFMYYLPMAPAAAAATDPAAAPEDGAIPTDDEYTRQLDNVSGTVARGVLPGNMLAFGSPDSARMSSLIVEAFDGVDSGSMKDVRVLFIGAAGDSDKVKAAVEPSGATYVFHEAK
jgi:hypothetical protein